MTNDTKHCRYVTFQMSENHELRITADDEKLHSGTKSSFFKWQIRYNVTIKLCIFDTSEIDLINGVDN